MNITRREFITLAGVMATTGLGFGRFNNNSSSLADDSPEPGISVANGSEYILAEESAEHQETVESKVAVFSDGEIKGADEGVQPGQYILASSLVDANGVERIIVGDYTMGSSAKNNQYEITSANGSIECIGLVTTPGNNGSKIVTLVTNYNQEKGSTNKGVILWRYQVDVNSKWEQLASHTFNTQANDFAYNVGKSEDGRSILIAGTSDGADFPWNALYANRTTASQPTEGENAIFMALAPADPKNPAGALSLNNFWLRGGSGAGVNDWGESITMTDSGRVFLQQKQHSYPLDSDGLANRTIKADEMPAATFTQYSTKGNYLTRKTLIKESGDQGIAVYATELNNTEVIGLKVPGGVPISSVASVITGCDGRNTTDTVWGIGSGELGKVFVDTDFHYVTDALLPNFRCLPAISRPLVDVSNQSLVTVQMVEPGVGDDGIHIGTTGADDVRYALYSPSTNQMFDLNESYRLGGLGNEVPRGVVAASTGAHVVYGSTTSKSFAAGILDKPGGFIVEIQPESSPNFVAHVYLPIILSIHNAAQN